MTCKIGVVGYSGQKFDSMVATCLLATAFQRAAIDKGDVELVSGLTDVGIPAIAYRLASIYGWETAGVACKKAKNYSCYDCDRVEIVGDKWGDESESFLGQIDALVRVGGGKQSMAEVESAKQRNIPVYEYDLPPIDM
jgi:hypothetical protein